MIFIIMGKAGYGKDTTAMIMKEQLKESTAIIHYADYIKWLYKHYFSWDGIKDEKARTDLQTIGTDIVRKTYDEDFWVKRVIEQIQIFNGQFDHFIIPDARFKNEVELMIDEFGSDQVVTIRVVRPDYQSVLTPEQQSHISENSLDGYIADFIIENTSMEHLREQVQWVVEGLNS